MCPTLALRAVYSFGCCSDFLGFFDTLVRAKAAPNCKHAGFQLVRWPSYFHLSFLSINCKGNHKIIWSHALQEDDLNLTGVVFINNGGNTLFNRS